MDKNDMKKFFIIQYIIIGLLVIVCLFLIVDKFKSEDTPNDNPITTDTNDYDVSMMDEVTADDILDMFEDNKSHVLYIGRATCGMCKTILPNLQAAQEELGYTTQYLDITTVDRNSESWNKVEKLLDKKTSLSVTNSEGEKELKSETYGYFIGTYGYTPSLIIIDNNKMVAGHIGNLSLNELKDWLQTNGIG